VAGRWRIRHKLMFGFGLVLAIMALLLLATLRGLYSYYITMNGIRAKAAELKAADEFKAAVGQVARLAEDPAHARRAARAPAPADGAPPLPAGAFSADSAPDRRPDTLNQAVAQALGKLDDYEHQLDEPGHVHEPVHADHQHALAAYLRARLAELQKATAPHTEVLMATQASDRELAEQERTRTAELIDRIEWSSTDLCNNVRDAQNEHINESRSHYQVSLWISIPTSVVGLLLLWGLVTSCYRWILYPIRDLGAGVARVGRGDFSRRIELHSGDEMEELAHAFNDMMQRLHDLYSDLARQVNERSRQLVRSDGWPAWASWPPAWRTKSTTPWPASPSAARPWRHAWPNCSASSARRARPARTSRSSPST
jgi:HAMP domain-containing protein